MLKKQELIMYKKIIIQKDGRLVLDLPKNLQNKLLEIFVVPVEETQIEDKIKQLESDEISDYQNN